MKVVTAIALATALLVGAPVPASAAPTTVDVAPLLAPTGTTVSITGGGCTSPVTISSGGFLFPAPPTVPVQLTLVPDPDGNWTTSFPMPTVPTYLVAECDGVSSSPTVIAPSDVDVGSLAVGSVTATSVEITTSPLVDGSTFSVFTAAGSLVATSVVTAGVGSVVVSRSLGPSTLTAIGLRQPDAAIALPYLPFAREVQLPLAEPTTLSVEPHVAPPGGSIVATGTCQGVARLVVSGRPNGWYDTPPMYVDVTPTVGPDGAWTHPFATPVLPSTARVTCSSGSVSDSVSDLIAPTSGDLPELVPLTDGSDVIADLPPMAMPGTMRAYAVTGEPLALVVEGTMMHIDLGSTRTPLVVVVGVESLGENAEALQVTRPQAWRLVVPSVENPTTTTVTPTTTSPAPPTSVGLAPPSGELPATGRANGTVVTAALLALGLGGIARLVAALRPRGR